jgi:uncharacterized protein YecE (DUF72 family)
MRFFVGTSGYSYKEWKGSFYPEKLPQKEMLSYYAQRFSTVEINNTFYRMPKASMLGSWGAQVPEAFRFVIKAPQRITHIKRLKEAEQDTDYLLSTISVLKNRLGPVLFQLPPNLKKDLARLAAFLDLIGDATQAAWEFRHESWLDPEVFDVLRARSAALCVADVDEAPTPELVSTARWGYIRLRRESYTDDQLVEWIAKLRSQPWEEVYVFFKHEDAGVGAKLGARFLELARM